MPSNRVAATDSEAELAGVIAALRPIDVHQLPWAWCVRRVPSRAAEWCASRLFHLVFRLASIGVRWLRVCGVGRAPRSPESVALRTLLRAGSRRYALRVLGDIERYRRSVLRVISPPTRHDLLGFETPAGESRQASPPYVWIAQPSLRPAACRRIVFYIHGGGFAKGDLAAFQHACALLSTELRALVAFPLYGLCPEHTIDQAVAQLHASYRTIRHRFPAVPLVMMADSAGGFLAARLLRELRRAAMDAPGALVLLSPLLDLSLSSPSVVANVAHDVLVDVDLLRWVCSLARATITSGDASPDWNALDYFPRTYLVACEDELLRDDSRRLEAALARCNIPTRATYWQGLCHAFPLLVGQLPEARDTVADIRAWLDCAPPVTPVRADSLPASS